ncbi:MAG: sensor domain-containing diguanylate cyclase [Acidobacteriota bacterium]
MTPDQFPTVPDLAIADLATRLAHARAALRARLGQRATLARIVRDVHAVSDSTRIGQWVVDRAAATLPATAWGVVITDEGRSPSLLAPSEADDELVPVLLAVAAWIIEHNAPFLTRNLAADPRVPGQTPSTVIGMPLMCRGQAIGAVVGVDRTVSRRAPHLAPGLLSLVEATLEPIALAIDQAQRMQRAEALSVTDDLTGLYNSRYLREALFREAKRAVRGSRPLSVLFIDLDGFKLVNDTHGHLAGSRTLVEAGEVIRSCARDSDVVSRYGGDEFVVVLPETGSEGAIVVARRVRDRLASHVFLVSHGLEIRLTASVGISVLPDSGHTPEDLLRAADLAMYHVKESGKNDIRLASAP